MVEWMPFIAHAGLTIGLFAWLRNDISALRRETIARIDALRHEVGARIDSTNARIDALRHEVGARFTELHHDIQAIDVRLARVEATLETTFRLQGVLPAERHDQVA